MLRLLDRILTARPELILLTDDEVAKLSAYLAELPRLVQSMSRMQAQARGELPDEYADERARRSHLRSVLRYNQAIRDTPRLVDQRTDAVAQPQLRVEPSHVDGSRVTHDDPKPDLLAIDLVDQARTRPGMKSDEAQASALRLAGSDSAFKSKSIHEMAKQIGCSPSTLRKTAFWTELLKEQPHRQRTKGPTPKAATFTPAVEARAFSSDEDDPLGRLIAAEEKAVIEQVNASGMDELAKAQTIMKLRAGDISPEEAIQVAKMHPASDRGPRKPFKKL